MQRYFAIYTNPAALAADYVSEVSLGQGGAP